MRAIELLLITCSLTNGPLSAQTVGPNATEQRELQEWRTNFTHASWAYRMFVMKHMVKEASFFSERLKLPTPHPILLSDVSSVFIPPPWFSKMLNPDTNLSRFERTQTATFVVSGVLHTTNYFFSFGGGRLWSLGDPAMQRLDRWSGWAKMHSLISSNGAYRLATQWLASISVDVPKMEQKFKPHVSQWYFHHISKDPWAYPRPPTTTNITLLPIFDVKWGEGLAPAVKVTVFGPTKQLIELNMNDTAFSGRPRLIITNALELNRIPDPPTAHRRRLLREHSTNAATETTNVRSARPPPFHLTVKPIPK